MTSPKLCFGVEIVSKIYLNPYPINYEWLEKSRGLWMSLWTMCGLDVYDSLYKS